MMPLETRYLIAVIREHGCAGCAYADPDPDRPMFICRRRPPNTTDYGEPVWPAVKPADWCGEWSPSDEPEADRQCPAVYYPIVEGDTDHHCALLAGHELPHKDGPEDDPGTFWWQDSWP